MSNKSCVHLGSYPKWMRTQPNQGSQNNPLGSPYPIIYRQHLCFAVPFPYTPVSPQCWALWTHSCFLGAARSWAGLFGIFLVTSLPQLWWCDPHSGLTSAGVVLGSDAVATDSASSGDTRCETEGGGLVVREREFLVYWKFSSHD